MWTQQTLEVLEGVEREYGVLLRERMLLELLWFFNENAISCPSSSVLPALHRLVPTAVIIHNTNFFYRLLTLSLGYAY